MNPESPPPPEPPRLAGVPANLSGPHGEPCAKPRPKRRWRLIIVGVIAALLLTAGLILKPSRLWSRLTLTMGEPQVTRAHLDEAIALGTRYLLAAQQPEGNFTYEYDWKADQVLGSDGDVRQAGALWGLSMLYAEQRTPELRAALERGLTFFGQKHAHLNNQLKTRWVNYPGQKEGRMGTVALVTLAHIEFLRTNPEMDTKTRNRYLWRLRGLIELLKTARTDDGRWHQSYDLKGKPFGPPSPYFDGEALLALVKAARYLGFDELRPIVLDAADKGYAQNVEAALKADADSDITKGYYQWSSMAFYELATSGWPGTERYGDHVLALADWMVHVHRTLLCTRNTAYAYEGLIHAYDLAKRRGLTDKVEELATVIDVGLAQLMSWQVGHSLAEGWDMNTREPPARAVGGVQNAWLDPVLRIDVVQHQLHALQLARTYVYP